MQLRKDILLFYLLIVVSVAVIAAAEKPANKTAHKKAGVKCCKLPTGARSSLPLNLLAEGIFRINA